MTDHLVNIAEAQFSIGFFDVDVKGGDIAALVRNFKETVLEYIQTFVFTKLNDQMKKALEATINSMLTSRDTTF